VFVAWLNWRPGGARRWKGKDRRLGRSGSGVWKDGTFKAIAPLCPLRTDGLAPVRKF
jgi:hypothetical protein